MKEYKQNNMEEKPRKA